MNLWVLVCSVFLIAFLSVKSEFSIELRHNDSETKVVNVRPRLHEHYLNEPEIGPMEQTNLEVVYPSQYKIYCKTA